MKLVDVLDSKSCVGNHVPVRVRPSANLTKEPLSKIAVLLCIYNGTFSLGAVAITTASVLPSHKTSRLVY